MLRHALGVVPEQSLHGVQVEQVLDLGGGQVTEGVRREGRYAGTLAGPADRRGVRVLRVPLTEPDSRSHGRGPLVVADVARPLLRLLIEEAGLSPV